MRRAMQWSGLSLCLIGGMILGGGCRGASAGRPVTRQPSLVLDVRDFGARGDARTLDTEAIQQALDKCGKDGGGIVRFKPGIYLSKPIFLRNRTTIQLDAGAILRATDERDDFVNGRGFVAFINGSYLTNLVITGKGAIDGSGERWWVPAEEARRQTSGYTLPRPRLVLLTHCNNVRIENVTLSNSPCFHLVPMECEDVDIQNVTIIAPAGSPNTDGIDPSMSRRVRISHCCIDVGDDNIAIKSGRPIPGRTFACEDITVTDCLFLHGHGLSIGSETVGGVRNLTVRRCVFRDTTNGIRIKSPRGRGGAVEQLSYSDITMSNVNPALTITCYYPKIPKTDTAQEVTPKTPSFRGIRIENLSATCPREAGVIVGLPESAVTNVFLKNVRITAAASGLAVRNAKDVHFQNVQIKAQGPPFIFEDAQVERTD